jgi:catechol 2,3-dioxygenase-like lactoylglutathione lyase family enzyme
MENIIAKLVQDFEKGFVNRRQLIQSLALAFTAGQAMAQAPAADAAVPAVHRPAFKTVELDHISYQVKDYRVTRDFYADLMGMEVMNDNGKNQCELHFGNSLLLARNHFRPREGAAPEAAAAAAPAAGGRPAPTSLVDHLAYRIYSWDTEQVRAELMRRGLATATTKPDTNGGPNYSSFHVNDPDGFNLQISGWAGASDSTNQKK